VVASSTPKSRTCPCSYFLVLPQVILERRRSAATELQGEEVELFPARQEEEEEEEGRVLYAFVTCVGNHCISWRDFCKMWDERKSRTNPCILLWLKK
jgi:hypothetical protein